MILKGLFAVLMLSQCLSGILAQGGAPLETVPELDLSAYIGLWYLMYIDLISLNTFQKDGVCSQANYFSRGDGSITVWNTQQLFEPTGELDVLKGQAYQLDSKDPGKFLLSFYNSPDDNPYWVLKLGPKLDTGDGVERYQYSIISDDRSILLYVLARDVDDFRENYDREVRLWLLANGFTGPINSPIEAVQTPECKYVKYEENYRGGVVMKNL
ncbi:apolipoprotein D-like [Glandiceps talaboti]